MPRSPKVPKPPDIATTTAAQTQSNIDTLRATQAAQNVSQDTPFGSLNYGITGQDQYGNNLWKATSALSPDQQQILDQLEGSQIGLGDAGGNLVADSSAMYSEAPDFSEAAGTQTRANMDRFAEYMNPTFTQQTEQLDNQLRNQGLVPGSPAYDRAMRTMQRTQGETTSSALNSYQQNAFNQAKTQYDQPLDTLAKIFGLTQPAALANSLVKTPSPTMGATDVAGITANNYNAQMEAYKAKLAQSNAMMSGLFGIGTSALTMGMGGPLAGMFGAQGASMAMG
jgi:hypothetical protein